jgi:hypothetical protein
MWLSTQWAASISKQSKCREHTDSTFACSFACIVSKYCSNSTESAHVIANLLPLLLPVFASLAADFIYSEYLTTQRKTEFKRLVWQIAQDYSNAALLLRLPGYVPMPAFTAIEDVPLVVRHARKFPAQVGVIGCDCTCSFICLRRVNTAILLVFPM